MSSRSDIAFLWSGLPDYAARCIGHLIVDTNCAVDVIATRPRVPIEGMEESLGQKIHWLDDRQEKISWDKFGLAPPKLLFVSGYAIPAFNSLADQARSLGTSVVLLSDHNWQRTLRQRFLDPIRHRLLINHKFDGLFVPGAAGRVLGEHCGFKPNDICEGLYGADSSLFAPELPLESREKRMLFVGQFIDRKNILGLVSAFRRFSDEHPEWTLDLCGSGPQRDQIEAHPKLIIHDFVQPPELAKLMASSRVLVLPSLEEHWGLVVHEAASSGCALLTTDNVGAGHDLIRPENGIQFPAGDEAAIYGALLELAGWQHEQWVEAGQYSLSVAANFGPKRFTESVKKFQLKLNG
ncbi:MAG: glycosyltransferase family 4 protein [Roseobacter sp.]